MKPAVLITRTRPDADALAAKLTTLGYEPLMAPMLEVRASTMPTPHDPLCAEGLIVTSAHALRHLDQTIREQALRHKTIYAVGPRTASLARELGWTSVHDGGGDVRHLGEFLKSRKEIGASSVLMHICGRDIANDTKQVWDSVPARIWEWVVYEADAVTGFPPEVQDALKAKRVRAALFHSARAAAAFGENVQAYAKAADFSETVLLCLSRAVLESLPSIECAGAYAASSPDEEALLGLLGSHVHPA